MRGTVFSANCQFSPSFHVTVFHRIKIFKVAKAVYPVVAKNLRQAGQTLVSTHPQIAFDREAC